MPKNSITARTYPAFYPVLADQPSPSVAVGDIASLLVTRLETLDFKASFDLNPGTFSIPTDVGAAELVVDEGTIAALSFHVDQEDGQSMVTRAQLTFVDAQNQIRPIIVKNPSLAGEDTRGRWASFKAWMKDALVDARLSGVSLTQDGHLKFSGRFIGMNEMIDLPMMTQIPVERLPTFHRKFENFINGDFLRTSGVPTPGAKPVDINALTAEISKILGRVNYTMSADTDTFALVQSDSTSRSAFGADHLHADMKGTGHLGFGPGGVPVLVDVQSEGRVELNYPVLGIKTGRKYEHLSAHRVELKGEVKLNSTTTPGELAGSAAVSVEGDAARVQFGPIKVDVSEPMELKLRLYELQLNPGAKTFSVHGSAKLPEAMPPIVETLAVDITENGGALTLAGGSDIDDFRYTRRLPAMF